MHRRFLGKVRNEEDAYRKRREWFAIAGVLAVASMASAAEEKTTAPPPWIEALAAVEKAASDEDLRTSGQECLRQVGSADAPEAVAARKKVFVTWQSAGILHDEITRLIGEIQDQHSDAGRRRVLNEAMAAGDPGRLAEYFQRLFGLGDFETSRVVFDDGDVGRRYIISAEDVEPLRVSYNFFLEHGLFDALKFNAILLYETPSEQEDYQKRLLAGYAKATQHGPADADSIAHLRETIAGLRNAGRNHQAIEILKTIAGNPGPRSTGEVSLHLALIEEHLRAGDTAEAQVLIRAALIGNDSGNGHISSQSLSGEFPGMWAIERWHLPPAWHYLEIASRMDLPILYEASRQAAREPDNLHLRAVRLIAAARSHDPSFQRDLPDFAARAAESGHPLALDALWTVAFASTKWPETLASGAEAMKTVLKMCPARGERRFQARVDRAELLVKAGDLKAGAAELRAALDEHAREGLGLGFVPENGELKSFFSFAVQACPPTECAALVDRVGFAGPTDLDVVKSMLHIPTDADPVVRSAASRHLARCLSGAWASPNQPENLRLLIDGISMLEANGDLPSARRLFRECLGPTRLKSLSASRDRERIERLALQLGVAQSLTPVVYFLDGPQTGDKLDLYWDLGAQAKAGPDGQLVGLQTFAQDFPLDQQRFELTLLAAETGTDSFRPLARIAQAPYRGKWRGRLPPGSGRLRAMVAARKDASPEASLLFIGPISAAPPSPNLLDNPEMLAKGRETTVKVSPPWTLQGANVPLARTPGPHAEGKALEAEMTAAGNAFLLAEAVPASSSALYFFSAWLRKPQEITIRAGVRFLDRQRKLIGVHTPDGPRTPGVWQRVETTLVAPDLGASGAVRYPSNTAYLQPFIQISRSNSGTAEKVAWAGIYLGHSETPAEETEE
jgi:hypothetical protein